MPDSVESLVTDAVAAPAGEATPTPVDAVPVVTTEPEAPLPAASDLAGRAKHRATDLTALAEAAQAGVGGRIRRALWRFLASLPGAEEGAASLTPPSEATPAAEPESTAPGLEGAAASNAEGVPVVIDPTAATAPESEVAAATDVVASEPVADSPAAVGRSRRLRRPRMVSLR